MWPSAKTLNTCKDTHGATHQRADYEPLFTQYALPAFRSAAQGSKLEGQQ